ncbi:MAG: hypothetical protein JRG84_09155 [Deltaproteobacteria bacterium]|nr:hypothetical protein [Deltaproteobacteria bacterium]
MVAVLAKVRAHEEVDAVGIESLREALLLAHANRLPDFEVVVEHARWHVIEAPVDEGAQLRGEPVAEVAAEVEGVEEPALHPRGLEEIRGVRAVARFQIGALPIAAGLFGEFLAQRSQVEGARQSEQQQDRRCGGGPRRASPGRHRSEHEEQRQERQPVEAHRHEHRGPGRGGQRHPHEVGLRQCRAAALAQQAPRGHGRGEQPGQQEEIGGEPGEPGQCGFGIRRPPGQPAQEIVLQAPDVAGCRFREESGVLCEALGVERRRKGSEQQQCEQGAAAAARQGIAGCAEPTLLEQAAGERGQQQGQSDGE